MKKSLNRFLVRHYLKKLLHCRKSIPTSEKAEKSINFFTVYINNEDRSPYLLPQKINGDIIEGLEWVEEKQPGSFKKEVSVNIDDILSKKIFVIHTYGTYEVRFEGICDISLGRVFYLSYIKIIMDIIRQYFFKKKKIHTKKSIDVLKILIKLHNEKKPIHSSIPHMMTDIYSINWVDHPDKEFAKRELTLHIDSFLKNEEIEPDSSSTYTVTGKAIQTIQLYEEQERKHRENVLIQMAIISLAVVTAICAVIEVNKK